jgi:hypothetical protein
VSKMAASDVEDGEIVGEVNENYQQCISPRKRHAATREAEVASAAGAQQQQQLPGWDDEQQPAGSAKRKPKKEKKKKQKDLAGQSAAAGNGHAAAAADAAGSQGQEATYVNVYGSNVSAADLQHTPQLSRAVPARVDTRLLGTSAVPCMVYQYSAVGVGTPTLPTNLICHHR